MNIRIQSGLVALSLSVVAACGTEPSSDPAGDTNEVNGLHSLAEAQKAVADFYLLADRREDVDGWMTPQLEQALDAIRNEHFDPILCEIGGRGTYTIDRAMRVGDQASMFVRDDLGQAISVTIGLRDLKLTSIVCPWEPTDFARGQGGCVAGGLYCGGDKVSGSKSNLYRCVAGATSTQVEVCARGCEVRPPGEDDRCAP
jgi:hypothetical protein